MSTLIRDGIPASPGIVIGPAYVLQWEAPRAPHVAITPEEVAAEVQRFIRTSPLADRCQITLLDFNAETLEYTRSRIKEAVRDAWDRVVGTGETSIKDPAESRTRPRE